MSGENFYLPHGLQIDSSHGASLSFYQGQVVEDNIKEVFFVIFDWNFKPVVGRVENICLGVGVKYSDCWSPFNLERVDGHEGTGG